jgi:cytochrome P450
MFSCAEIRIVDLDAEETTMMKTKLVFDPYSADFFTDPFDTYRRMREEAPVYYNETYDFYALSRHEDVAAALKDFRTYSSGWGSDLEMIRSAEKPPVPSVIFMDPPEHRHMRSLINKVFTRHAIRAQRDLVAEQIDRHLSAVGAEFDVVQDFSALFPVEVISRMLGVPAEHRRLVRHCVDESLHREPGRIEMTETGVEAVTDAMLMYSEVARQRRSHPEDDMISALAAAETGLNDLEIAMFAATLGGAGAETVTKLLGNAAVTLWRHPDQWQTLFEDRTKVPIAVEELLRYDGPTQYVARKCLREVHLHGTTVPAGKPVLLVLGSANRDPEAFSDPDTFDIERDRSQAQPLGLGYGVHSCLGAALARMEATMALERLLDFMPRYEVFEGGLTRVSMVNVAGWNTVPVRVLR